MENDKDFVETDEKDIPNQEHPEDPNSQPHRIQFLAAEKPDRSKDDGIAIHNGQRSLSVGSASRRAQSIASLPPVISARDRKIREREAKDENKHVDVSEHLMATDEVARKYKTNINTSKPAESLGLESAQAAQLLIDHGPNNLTPPSKRHWLLKFWDCLSSLFNLLLILAGILEYILLGIDFKGNFQNTYLGAILIIVAFINAFIEFYQAQKSEALLESFLNMIPPKCKCIRDGKMEEIDAINLVPGDVVYVKLGDKTPADLLVFHSSDCKVDNSSLTGESEPQERGKDNDMQNPLEATNLMFNSTSVVSGEAYGIVIRTGDATVIGQIASLTAGENTMISPLSREIDNFVKFIAAIAIFTALVFFGVAFPVNNNNVSLAINFAIGIFVAFVPEGLPATVTMLLTIAAKRMASENVLVKDLKGVETLGAITLLATDKTGTLTRNQMTTTNLWTCGELYDTTSSAGSENNVVASVDNPGVLDILHISALCSRAKFDRIDVPMKERTILGDATETGLIRYATTQLPDYDNLESLYPKVFEIPFNSENKWYMSIHKKAHPNGGLTLFIKGAPERVWKLCNRILTGIDGASEKINDTFKQAYDLTYENMASQGYRVLGFAELYLPGNQYPHDFVFDKKSKNYPQGDFTFVGLASLQDPPKHGVREAIGKCREAGIKVMMVTGDHPLTAEAIGRKINLMLGDTKDMVAKRTVKALNEIDEDEFNAVVIHGEQIEGLSDLEWDNIFWKDEIIFARTSPKHKLEIVRRAQSMGHIVGVTGDGVNDAPALKKADLGISMNVSGSDVSKEAASMILLDDNFASTVKGIEEGRLIFINLKKSIQYTISHSTPEVIPNLLYVIVPIPLPLSAILILVIDLGFELIAALSFAWDPAESETGLMKLPPRKPVTPHTCNIFRARALRKSRGRFDEESGVIIPVEDETKFKRFLHGVREVFIKTYWTDKFENTGAEVLVDGPLLSWAYLEIGMIEAIGALLSFFLVLHRRGVSPYDARVMQRGSGAPTNYWTKDAAAYKGITGHEQADILAEAQSMYYWAIMTMQICNLFACKARLNLPFGKYMFANRATFYCIFSGAALAAFIIYTPGVEIVFKTSKSLSPLYWLIPMAFGFFIIAYASLRMLIRRRLTPIKWSPEIGGLQMYPTMHSSKSAMDRKLSAGQ